MAQTNALNSITFDSFFQSRILDNNNVSVADINKGLQNLFKTFNENEERLFFETEKYIVSEYEDGYPDLIARNCQLGQLQYWWWIVLLNRLENPTTDLKTGWAYAINPPEQITEFINISNSDNSTNANSRIGTLVELN
jgi:hypothetical protein